VAERLAGAGGPLVSALVERVLASPAGGPGLGHSRLNNDGTPLQLCLTATASSALLRLIGDPAAHLAPEARLRVSREALRAALMERGAQSLVPPVERSLRLLIPSAPEARARYPDGFIWIAVAPDRPEVGFYVEAAPLGHQQGWERAQCWLEELLPCSEAARRTVAVLRETAIVSSMGLEGSRPEDCRAKVYFRFARPTPLGELAPDLFAAEEMRRCLRIAMGEHGVGLDGLVASVGFRVASGEVADVKIDLCGHCLPYDNEEWLARIEGCRSEMSVHALPVREALGTGDCEVAFFGVGLTARREPRLNVYLKPRGCRVSPGEEELRAALDDAVRYLIGIQDRHGSWTDYHLPVGPSDQWTTAYVGHALARCGPRLDLPQALAAAGRAADWLVREKGYHAGWGYNGRTGPDADSTAIALALMRALDRPVGAEDRAFLRAHWRPEGGAATYQAPHAWGTAHWDVTPWAYLVLAREDREALRESFLMALRASLMPNGLWRSYWWRRPFYSTFVTLEVLAELGIPEPSEALPAHSAPIEIDNAFDLACWIGIENFRAASPHRIGAHLRALLDWQEAGGRWPPHPNLRVTDESCYAPWEAPVGACYADEKATVTTATAVRVLTHLLSRRANWSTTCPLKETDA
jgi:hypothetical protein